MKHRYALFAPLQRQLHLVLAHRAFQPQHDLLCRLRLLVEHGLRLTTVTGLLAVVAPLALRKDRVLALLVLRYFMGAGDKKSSLFMVSWIE